MRTRGVITSAAVRAGKSSERAMISAVVSSRVPTSAERRTSAASSSGVRALDSSSCGSTPTARSSRFALPLSKVISGPTARLKARSGPATTFAVASGAEMPRFCGSSSPMIIEKTVAMNRPRPTARGGTRSGGTPAERNGGSSSVARDGSTRKPTTSVVSVIPTWAPESWVESARTARSTPSARRSPASTARSTADRSTLTRENSPATNRAVPMVRSTPRPTRSHSVTEETSQCCTAAAPGTERGPAYRRPPLLAVIMQSRVIL